MKYNLYLPFSLLLCLIFIFDLNAQPSSVSEIKSEVSRSEVELNIRFLASDELRGRATGSDGIDVAARYIASWFLSNGVVTAPGNKSYYQTLQIPLRDNSGTIKSQNVIGVIEGSDPQLKDEYVLLSAHYDHVGIGPATAEGDSIYNGARDNAVGVSAVMAAGKYFAEHPPKRSILLALWTAEEMGLVGSRMFVEAPVVPLNQIVFNLNLDNAAYNDTTKVTVVGLERTDAEPLFKSAANEFGLEAIPSPVPELNLFNRSDNVHFARKGIPAPTYSLGFTSFDDRIQYYYHQATDEAESLNFSYVTKYIWSYVLAVEKIANSDKPPFWIPGDEFENAGKNLYSTP